MEYIFFVVVVGMDFRGRFLERILVERFGFILVVKCTYWLDARDFILYAKREIFVYLLVRSVWGRWGTAAVGAAVGARG